MGLGCPSLFLLFMWLMLSRKEDLAWHALSLSFPQRTAQAKEPLLSLARCSPPGFCVDLSSHPPSRFPSGAAFLPLHSATPTLRLQRLLSLLLG